MIGFYLTRASHDTSVEVRPAETFKMSDGSRRMARDLRLGDALAGGWYVTGISR